ncbi:DUF1622 domain-containing protein [Ochrobactrum grignonense]|nr:DUF1622 domain-containing protein [Brucella grignonensis]
MADDMFVLSGEKAYTRYRANLGRGIALGLIVLIRTFLSFSLEAENDGEWPWKRRHRGRAITSGD